MNKPLAVTITTTLLFTLTILPVFAQDTDKNSSFSGKQQQQLTTRLENLKTRAQAEITRRITSLTELSNRISGIKHLTDSQKSTLTSNIQTEIMSLNALQAKITGDTDAQTVKADVKSVITSYRVYVLYMPQVRIILASDELLDSADKFSALGTKLQSRISEAQSKGEDVSTLQTTYTDFQAKATDAQTQANNAIIAITPLQPQDYPGNKTTLQSARTMLQAARQDLKTARQDAQTITQGLRTNSLPTGT